jgi:Glutaredoxin
MEEGKAIQDYLKKKTGQKTVPNIFISRFTPLKYLALFSFLLLQTKNTSVVC